MPGRTVPDEVLDLPLTVAPRELSTLRLFSDLRSTSDLGPRAAVEANRQIYRLNHVTGGSLFDLDPRADSTRLGILDDVGGRLHRRPLHVVLLEYLDCF